MSFQAYNIMKINYTIVLLIFACILLFAGELFTQGLGNVSAVSITDNALYLSVGSDVIVFKPCTEKILMVNYRPNGVEDPDTLVVARTTWDYAGAIIDTSDSVITVGTAAYRLEIGRTPLRFHLSKIDHSGESMICEEPASGGNFQDSIALTISNGSFYGVHNRSTGILSTPTGGAVTSGNQGQAGGPFTWTTHGWGFLADADGGTIAIAGNSFSFARKKSATKRDIEYYFIFGSPKEIIRGLYEITGFPPLFPKYTYGYMNTEWGIDQTELYSDIKTYRNKKIPIDAYILDFDWMDWGGDNYGEFHWGPKFPDGQSGTIVDSLVNMSMHLMGIRKPRIHVNTVQGMYCVTNNFFIDYTTDYFSGKQVGRLNFNNPAVRKWYWESFALQEHSYEKGITGYWNDEADEYGGNLMFMQMQRAEYEGQRAYNDKRVWSINRNFYTGAQRYAYGLWSGDIQSGFTSMANQRLFMLSSITLGVPWWGMDIGGFQSTPTSENYYRWIQFGAFVPIFRVHAMYNQEREPWYFGTQAESIATKYIRLRYILMPYIYSAAWENHCTGVPIVRPLIMEYPDDPAVENLASEWLFGNDILVSPVVISGATKQSVYIPEGTWYDYHTGKLYTGTSNVEVSVTSNNIPIFVKAGAIIPMSSPALFTDAPEMKKTVILSSYPNGSGTCTLYDDDGITYAYEQGMFRTVTVAHERDAETAVITIAAGTGPFATPERDWLAQFNWVGSSPDSIVLDGITLKQYPSDSVTQYSLTGWCYDSVSQKCLVKFPDDHEGHLLHAYFHSSSSGILDEGNILQYRLGMNHPNPFNASTRINFSLARPGDVRLVLYDFLGRKSAILADGYYSAGEHEVHFNASTLSSGIYFYTIRSKNFNETKKLVLLK
jgi:alpha-glucosidase